MTSQKKAKICFDRWRCSWVLAIRDRTVDGAADRHRHSSLGDKGSRHERQMAHRVRGLTGGTERVKKKTKQRIQIWDQEAQENKIQGFCLKCSALKVRHDCSSGQCRWLYHLHKWPEGRLKPLAGESIMSIFIEWNWFWLEDRSMLARLLLSPQALSDQSASPLAEQSFQQHREPAMYKECPLTVTSQPMKVTVQSLESVKPAHSLGTVIQPDSVFLTHNSNYISLNQSSCIQKITK